MSSHPITLSWNRDDKDFGYKSYSRDHDLDFGHGVSIRASAAADYLGTAEIPDPEQAFVASLSSCHMLTFLAVAAIGKWKVESYEDDAVGYLEKNETGKMSMNRVVLRPSVRFSGEGPNQEELSKLHEKAHRGCFIASSINTEVRIEPPSV